MDYMHDLKDLLCADLEDHTEKSKKSGKMSMGDLETIHKLTDTVKNILKIGVLEQQMDGGYSEDGRYMGEGRIYGMSYDDGVSYDGGSSYARRGGRGRGRNARRDSMGRYSSRGGSSYYNGMMGDQSFARGGRGGDHGYSREGGYSRDDGKHYMMGELERLMGKASTHTEREVLEKCMQELERA